MNCDDFGNRRGRIYPTEHDKVVNALNERAEKAEREAARLRGNWEALQRATVGCAGCVCCEHVHECAQRVLDGEDLQRTAHGKPTSR